MVFWHRELPPLDAEPMAEHTVEAQSSRVSGTIAHRDELWDRGYRQLMANAERRLVQEVARLGGHFAHVVDETIEPKHDAAAGEAWLHGRFNYLLYRRPEPSASDRARSSSESIAMPTSRAREQIEQGRPQR
jgi:hypothetical protein